MDNLHERRALPEGWEWKSLGDVAQFFYGYPFDSSQFNNEGCGTPLIRIRNLIDGKTETYYDGEFDESYIIKNGDILIGMDGEFNIVKWTGQVALLNQRVCKLNITSEELEPAYAYRVLVKILKRIEDKTPYVTVKHLSAKHLNSIQIPLPPLPTQRRIVSILEKAEETTRLRGQADELTDRLLQSVFLEMFGDPVKNPKGWNTESLGAYSSFLTSGSRGWAKFYSKEGAKFVRVQNLTGHRLSFEDIAFITPPDTAEAKRTKVKPKDLLISITGQVGLVAIVPEDIGDAYVSQHVAIVRLREGVESKFLTKFLAFPNGGQHQIMKRQYGQTKPGIGLEDIKAIHIFVPPLPLQQKFARIVEKIESMRQSQNQSKQQIEDLFSALMQKAFRGELEAEDTSHHGKEYITRIQK